MKIAIPHLFMSFVLTVSGIGGCKDDEGESRAGTRVAVKSGDPTTALPGSDPVVATPTPTQAPTPPQTSSPAPVAEPSPAPPQLDSGLAGILAFQIQPMEGADATTVAGAAVTAVGHPEIAALTGEDGAVEIGSLLPGTLDLVITSAALALEGGSSKYGIKLDGIVVRGGERQDLGKRELKETGSLTGHVVFLSKSGDLDLTGSEVFIPGTSFIAKTDAEGAFALGGLPAGSYALRAQHTGFAVLDLKQVVVVDGEASDLGEIVLSLSNGPEGGISVSSDAQVELQGRTWPVVTAATRAVDYQLSYDSDAVLMKVSDEPSFLNKEWVPVAKIGQWTGFSTDGKKTLYVMYSDLNGLESSPYSIELIVDADAPKISGIELLNGWAQTASTSVFVDVDAVDAGVGIKEIRFSESASTFTTAPVPYATRVSSLELSSANAVKTVYAKVVDHVGRESAVVSDQINLLKVADGGVTIIAGGVHKKPITLLLAHSPYYIDGGASPTFEGDVTIEPGVEVRLHESSTFEVKGTLTAIGTSGDPITLKRRSLLAADCAAVFSGQLKFKGGAPGVSAKNVLRYVRIQQIASVNLDGGLIENSHFDSSSCTAGTLGAVYKSGHDALEMRFNHYSEWSTALAVEQGANVVNFHDHSNDDGVVNTVVTALRIIGDATGVSFKNNEFTGIYRYGSGMLEPLNANATYDLAGTIFDGDGTVVAFPQSSYAAASAIVSGLDVRACRTIAFVGRQSPGTGPSVLISNSTFDQCDSAVSNAGDAGGFTSFGSQPIRFEHNDVTVTRRLIEGFGVGSSPALPTVFFVKNNVTCAAPSGQFCDLYHVQRGTTYSDDGFDLTMSQNNVHCPGNGAEGCRGFTFYVDITSFGVSFKAITFALDGNYWTGKAAATNMLASITTLLNNANGPLDAGNIGVYGRNADSVDRISLDGTVVRPSPIVIGAPVADAGPE